METKMKEKDPPCYDWYSEPELFNRLLAEHCASQWYRKECRAVQRASALYPPFGIYRLRDTGHHALIFSFSTDVGNTEVGGCCVNVISNLNPDVLFNRTVFGIELDDLEPIGFFDPEGTKEVTPERFLARGKG